MTSLPFLLLVLSLTQPCVFAASNLTQVLVGTNVTGWRTGNCDSSAADNCDQRASCENGLLGTTEYYRCVCEQGGTGDGYADSTGCIFQSQPCTNNSQCHANGMCNLGKCVCKANFFGDGFHVCSENNIPTIYLDVNNITDWRNGTCSKRFLFCDTLANCEQGRVGDTYYFRCFCPKGFVGDGYKNGTGCPPNRTKCDTNKDCHQYGFCNTTDFYCQCKPGFYGDGATCNDIDECATFPCDKNAKCDNIPGSFVCTCNFEKHYEGNGFVCKHRCDTDFHCHPDARCNTTIRTCTCKPGYSGDGVNCTDINECAGPNICQKESTCINEPGSYKCKCNNGFTNVVNRPGYCKALPRDCEDIRVNFTHSGNGLYQIDPDFIGQANNFTVYCKFLTDYAITIVNPSEEVDKVDAKGDLLFEYGTDRYTLQALLSHSYYCHQYTLLSCESSFRYNTDFMWQDAFNQTHTSWAGSSVEGMCSCGQLRKCHLCNCNNRKSSDFGYFVNKNQLPVMFVRFGSGPGGKLTLSGLQCGPRTFDIPKDCEYWKTSNKLNPNGAYPIDLDGAFGNPPVLVYCDLRTYEHVAITEMQVQQENISLATQLTVPVNYLQATRDVLLLVNNSQFCIQRVEYVCQNSGITGGRVYVNVSSDSRRLPYFPGANGVADSCGCGATQSCQNTAFRCNCDILDGVQRRDLGDIINRADLPVRAVTGGTPTNENYFQVSHVQCGRYQFGIPPNCERLRAQSKEKPYGYSYLIDPDYPPIGNNILGNVPPFLAECRFNNNPGYGITVIHHTNENWFEVSAGFLVTYLQVTLLQLAALKTRSTYCIQNIDISCHSFSLTFSGEASTWRGLDQKDYLINETLTSCKTGAGCQCDGSNMNRTDKGMLKDLAALPVTSMNLSQIIGQLTSVSGSSASIKLGPLECTELFPTCAALYQFVDSLKRFGEKLPETETIVAVDPDGAGGVEAFEVTCKWPADTVITVIYPPSNGNGLVTNDPTGKSKCFDVVYREPDGDIITREQLLALRDKSANCFQSLFVDCQYAKVHDMVNFTTCDGKDQIGWAGSVGKDSCQCGVTRHCEGGRNFKCHCDLADGQYRRDGAIIIRKDRLPVCEVCLKVDGIPLNMSSVIPRRLLRFRVSPLNCHAGGGRHVQTSCQIVRMAYIINKPTTNIVYMNRENPIPVACKHLPNPPTGTLEVFPQQQVHRNVSGNVNITVKYYTVNMSIVIELMQKNVYCSQRVYFFCVSDDTPEFNLTGADGWRDNNGVLRQTWDRLRPEEIDRSVVCHDFSELCEKCSGIPRGYVIYTKALLPVTGLQLTIPDDKVTIVVDSVNCFDLYQHCYGILRDGGAQWWSRSGHHAVDPDGPGRQPPLKVQCTYKANSRCAITTVSSEPVNRDGRSRTGAGGKLTEKVTYFQNTPKQIQALTNASAFCWQPVAFDCIRSPLINKNASLASHYNLQHTTSYSFGTGADTDFLGCSCGVTGSCGGTNNDTCRCDINAATLMRDEGIVSDGGRLPVTAFVFASQGVGSSSKMSAGDIKCSNTICKQFPRDCHEALTKYKKFEANGINYRRSGEFLIHPKPRDCAEPFLVYCEMDLVNNIGITKIMTKATEAIILRPGDTKKVGYYGLTKEQIQCLVDESSHCIQPVAYQCYEAMLLGGGVRWTGSKNVPQNIWGGGVPSTCACGAGQVCGGDDSRTQQQQRKCSCDIMDSVWRKDAGVFTIKNQLPLTYIDLRSLTYTNDSRINITIGDLQCSQSPIGFNECATVYHDCSEHADCIDRKDGFACKCHKGWEGLTQNRTFNPDLPVANGRECPDDNECTYNRCPIGISDCVNTPGSFECYCHQGFEKTGPTACRDVDECATNKHNCDVNARCINQYGTFKCVCHKNYRGNGTRGNCHKIGNCVIFGDPHLVTFDDLYTDYQGVPECPLVAITDECPGPNSPAPGSGKIKVLYTPWKKNPPRHGIGRFTWLRNLEIHIKGHVIKMLQGRKLIVDGIEKLAYIQGGIIIFDNGRNLVLKTDTGIEIYWDGVDVADFYMPTTYKDRLCGMCGNFNGNSKDEFIVGPGCNGTAPGSNGTVVRTDNQAVFGNSWMTPSGQCVPSCEPTPPGKTCIISDAQAEKLCAQVHDLQISRFKECLKKLDHKELVNMQRACVFDICRVESDTDAMVCKYAEQVAAKCQQNTQVDVSSWRTPDFCSKVCEDNRVYRVCDGDLSQQSQTYTSCLQFRAPNAGFTVNTGCVADCYCPKGYLEEGSKCVKEEDCGCFFNGTYVKKGQILTTENCGESVLCGSDGVVKNVTVVCGDYENCTLKDGVVGCHCVDGYIRVKDKCKPDPCAYMKCKKGAECVQGQCQCKKGYLGDCESCHDLNECTTDVHHCVEESHEKCVNTEGSYYCACEPGYYRSGGGRCLDIDECKLGEDRCPANSQCVNRDGNYGCSCCIGYTFSKGKCVWEDEDTEFFNASAPNITCCDCNTPACNKSGSVCGSDGATYPSVRALVVQSCLQGKKVHAMYEGSCQPNCSQVKCLQPFAKCEESTTPGKPASCGCPTCTNIDIKIINMVCASDTKIYRTKCEFEAAMCINNIVDVIIINDPSTCTGKGGPGGPGNSTGWSNCSTPCGFGEVNRNVTTSSGNYTIKAICYKSCENQTCANINCTGDRHCIETPTGPQCSCPFCGGEETAQVCGSVGKDDPVTYRNFCELKKEACLRREKYYKLEDNACPREPLNCNVMNFYEWRKDRDGCVNTQPELYPVCKGGCGVWPDKCCYQKSTGPPRLVKFKCPNGVIRNEEVAPITECRCIPPSELAAILAAQKAG